MVNIACGVDRGSVRPTTTTTTSRNMAVILLVERGMQPWFTAYIFDIGHPYYGQLTVLKTWYPLTSIT